MAPSWPEKNVFNFAAQISGARFCFAVSCISEFAREKISSQRHEEHKKILDLPMSL
jgi:hypothetical protein